MEPKSLLARNQKTMSHKKWVTIPHSLQIQVFFSHQAASLDKCGCVVHYNSILTGWHQYLQLGYIVLYTSVNKMMMIINIIIIIVIITSLGLSWDATLKMTGIKLELITDVVMFQFIEKGMRGGISYISLKY